MERRNDQNDRQAAKEAALNWTGVSRMSQTSFLAQLRAIRNQVSQTMNRGLFSKGVTGSDIECMYKMTLGIVHYLANLVNCPKGGLAHILGVHTTRMAAILERKHWPKSLRYFPYEVLIRSTFWILLGRNWEDYKTLHDSTEGGKTLQGDLHLHFMASSYCYDIVNYFFTDPRRANPGSPPYSVAQPYFFSERKDWNSPYDRAEMRAVIAWTRRQIIAYESSQFSSNSQHGLIAFFAPNAEILNRLIDEGNLRPEVALASYQLSSLGVMALLQNIDAPGDSALRTLKNSIRDLATKSRNDTACWRDWSKSRPEGVIEIDCAGSATTQWRGLLAMMFLGYYRMDSNGLRRCEHVFLCRPFLDPKERRTPFCIMLTDVETDEFLRQYDKPFDSKFKVALMDFRAASPAPLERYG